MSGQISRMLARNSYVDQLRTALGRSPVVMRKRHRLSKHVSPETLTMIGLDEHYEQPAEFQTLYELRWRGETN